MKSKLWIGIDVGSISVKAAILTDAKNATLQSLRSLKDPSFFSPCVKSLNRISKYDIILSQYMRHHGEPWEAVVHCLGSVKSSLPVETEINVWVTGSGGKLCRDKGKFHYVNEYRAVAEALGVLYPDVKTVFELGGERSKYILLDRNANDRVQVIDYETNGECAAGTGSFFDQQLGRLQVQIEDVGSVIEGVHRCASIAGRCSVFAKSDMIHAQQRGYQPPEVLKGLCQAVARNYKGTVTKGKSIQGRVAFIGGVAANKGVVDSLKSLFGFTDGELVVPEIHHWIGAFGAALIGTQEQAKGSEIVISPSTERKHSEPQYPTTTALSMEKVHLLRDRVKPYQFPSDEIVNGFLGIDIGSVSTNLALIDKVGNLIHGIYCMTEGRPIEVVKQALQDLYNIVQDRVQIQGVGTTGSGRELIAHLVGADIVKDEITAHKAGAVHISKTYLDQQVDTIFEVGGQDSKFISLNDGVVVDFTLNEACAAGTGSFLEEQARQIGIEIKDEFAKLALASKHPLRLGERCTVFMEKELNPYLHHGVPKEDIVAGLAISVVQNYLNRVVKKRKIGDCIFFQGGTAYNDSVAAAFSTVLDKEIIIPPHNGIMGAIGTALLARDHGVQSGKSHFRGWDLSKISWQMREFVCEGCSNACLMQEFDVEGDNVFWGDKCSNRYRKRSKTDHVPSIPDLMKQREEWLLSNENLPVRGSKIRGKIGLPRILYFYDRLPFWQTFFKTLGFETVLSEPTKRRVVDRGVEATVAEPCFPIQAAHGHLLDLDVEDVDFVFLPNVINEEDPTDSVASFLCPWGQTMPLVASHTPAFNKLKDRLISPNIQFRAGFDFVQQQLTKSFRSFNIPIGDIKRAVRLAYKAQKDFRKKIEATGRHVTAELESRNESCVLLLGRAYNLYDPGLNLGIPEKLRDQYGANIITLDFLPLDEMDISAVNDHMFWHYGRRIIQGARYVKEHPNYHIIYLSNFKCGPDSYIRHYIEDASGRPFLFLQLDSHANDAGIMTRIEAFLESKGLI